MNRRSDNECRLFELLVARSFLRGRFLNTASGRTSKYRLDVRRTSLCTEGARLIGEIMYERIRTRHIYGVGGMAADSPLIVSTVVVASLHASALEGFWVSRDRVQSIEGAPVEGSRVVILESVMGSGENTLRAINGAWELGCKVVAVIALIDRLEGGGWRLRNHKIHDYESIYTIEDFGVKPRDRKEVNRERSLGPWGMVR